MTENIKDDDLSITSRRFNNSNYAVAYKASNTSQNSNEFAFSRNDSNFQIDIGRINPEGNSLNSNFQQNFTNFSTESIREPRSELLQKNNYSLGEVNKVLLLPAVMSPPIGYNSTVRDSLSVENPNLDSPKYDLEQSQQNVKNNAAESPIEGVSGGNEDVNDSMDSDLLNDLSAKYQKVVYSFLFHKSISIKII